MAAEKKRGCGYRKIGGIYLCADGPGEPCHRLPIPLDICPTCHHGVKQTRGWTWVDFRALAEGTCDGRGAPNHCAFCIVCNPDLVGLAADKNGNTSPGIFNKAGLIWIGETFYKTPADFTREAQSMGVSRRVTAVPKGFKVGEHYILVAHPRAVPGAGAMPIDDVDGEMPLIGRPPEAGPGIFHAFQPTRVEKILADDTPAEEIQSWKDKGFTVVLLPAGDKDHQGTVYDKAEAEEAAVVGGDQ